MENSDEVTMLLGSIADSLEAIATALETMNQHGITVFGGEEPKEN